MVLVDYIRVRIIISHVSVIRLLVVAHVAVGTTTGHDLSGRVVEKMRPRKDAKRFIHRRL